MRLPALVFLVLPLLLPSCTRQVDGTHALAFSGHSSPARELDRVRQQYDGEIINFSDSRGNRQGHWIENFDSPSPPGDRDSLFMEVHKEMYYANGLLDGSYREYKRYSVHPFISGEYKRGRKHGTWIIHEDGKERTEVYTHGKLIHSS
jgi:hypothetical protein